MLVPLKCLQEDKLSSSQLYSGITFDFISVMTNLPSRRYELKEVCSYFPC